MRSIAIGTSGHRPTVNSADWHVLDPARYVEHLPTALVFEVYVDPRKGEDDVLAFGDFRADLIAESPHRARPPGHKLRQLGREAICISLNHMGAVRLVEPVPRRISPSH